MSIITTIIKSYIYCHQNDEGKMGSSPILSVIHTVTIGTFLNFNGGNKGHRLQHITCRQTFAENANHMGSNLFFWNSLFLAAIFLLSNTGLIVP